MELVHPERTALVDRTNLEKNLEGGSSVPTPVHPELHAEPAKIQGGTTEQVPSLEPNDSVVIFHPESSEVITVDGTDQKDGRKRDRERRRPSGRDRDRRDDRTRDRTRDRDRDRDRGGLRRGIGNWDKASGNRVSRRDRDREKNGDSSNNASRRENWAEFQRRQKTRQTETRSIKRTKDPDRDTSYDYIVPQNYLYDDRSNQEYETSKKRSNRLNRNSPDNWKHDKYDPNEQANLPEDGDSSFDRWALADYIK